MSAIVVFADSTADAAAPVPAWEWGPAGRDVQLARAVSDLTTGGYLGSTRELLSAVRGAGQFDRRAYCSSVLAALTARRRLSCAHQWLVDEPTNPDALLLHARVLIVQAIHAYRAKASGAAAVAQRAVQACRDAALAAPQDPTPWVTLLSLGQFDPHHRELWPVPGELGWGSLCPLAPTSNEKAICGPWWLLGEIIQRDPFNREAFHRLIPCCASPPWVGTTLCPELAAWESATVDDTTAQARMAVWAADHVPEGSPLKLLRLMHCPQRDPFPNDAELMRLANHVRSNGEGSRTAYLHQRIPAIEERWRLALRLEAVTLTQTWFAGESEPPYMPLSDLSFLADYLHKAGELRSARRVLKWMIPYATAEPWRRDGDPGHVLAKICLECGIHPGQLPH